jgi:glycosyltransferase involved in cell wall biosynthesis
MGGPRVAVVIICFNDGDFVEDAVASVREEEPVELIVVDDGSTSPSTRRVLERIAARGIKVVGRPNGGPSAARMTGVAATSAAYVFPLDADDELEVGCLGRLADELDHADDIAFVYGHLVFTGALRGGRLAQPWDPFVLLYANRWGAPCLYRRSALEAVGGWSLDDSYEDWDLLMALAEHGYRGAPVDRLVLHYRRHANSRMNVSGHRRHAAIYRKLRSRHAPLFAQRAELARIAGAARWRRIAYPLLLGERRYYPFGVFYALEWLRDRRWRAAETRA